MICEFCAQAADTDNMDLHGKCRGETWCDCGHMRIKIKNGQRQTKSEGSTQESSGQGS
jgi:hypothetical protein